ncbi:MAG: hypothetical protein ACX939_01030 [Hyphococcus sp.]
MKRRFSKHVIPIALAATVIVPCLSTAAASPWTRASNELLLISRADYFRADLGPVETDTGVVDSQFERLEANLYSEFGVTDHIMIGGKAIYGTSWLTRGGVTETSTGFSEIETFGQYQVLRSNTHAAAARVAVVIPAGFESGVRPALQADSVDVDIAALYGRNLLTQNVKVFSTLEVGYRRRIGDPADQIRLQSALGIEPRNDLLFLIDAFVTLSLRNERPGGADFDVVKIQPSLLWRFSRRFGVQAGVTEEVAGRNIDLGRTVFLGLWSTF